MTALFKVSTGVLIATAVVLVGQGVHSFEEVGLMPLLPIRFPRVEFLGIYPDGIGLIAQLVVALSPAVWKAGAKLSAMGSGSDGAARRPGE
jgi:high-affinity iron transporter